MISCSINNPSGTFSPIIEQGNHEQLLHKNGYYAQLNRYQNETAPMRTQTVSAFSNQTSEGAAT